MDLSSVALFLLALLTGYMARRRAYLGLLDPLQLLAVSEAVWVVTVHALAVDGGATNAQATLFTAAILLWWALWLLFGQAFGRRYVDAIRQYWIRLDHASGAEKATLIGLYAAFAFIVLAVTVMTGGGGDNRLSVMKFLRPIEGVTALLPIPVLYLLLTRNSKLAKLLLVALLLQMIFTGGKSAILSILLPLTGMMQTGKLTVRPRHLVAIGGLIFCGFAASTIVNYGVAAPGALFDILYSRISLDGDVYLLALPNDVIYQTTTTSLSSYLTGPILKTLLLPVTIDENIGSQISSIISGQDTPNGPNPHWPVVLMAYGIDGINAVGLSIVAFTAMLLVKFRLIAARVVRRLPLPLVVPLGAFILSFPTDLFR